MFGLNLPEDLTKGRTIVRYWGARAIFQRGTLDLLPDRQHYQGPDHDERLLSEQRQALPFLLWLNSTALPWLRKEARILDPTGSEMIHFAERSLLIAACPQRSHGYLYIGAAQFEIPDCTYDLPEWPHNSPWQWTGAFTPRIGDRVRINFNQLGTGTVVSFFVEYKCAGVRVKLDAQPEWHKKQGQPPYALVFGPEVAKI